MSLSKIKVNDNVSLISPISLLRDVGIGRHFKYFKRVKMLNNDKIDLAYAAGVIDSDGSIMIRHGKARTKFPRHILTIVVGMADADACKWLHEKWPGRLWVQQDNPKWRPIFRWQIYSNKAAEFLKQILPYLKVKSRQAKIAIEFQEKLIMRHVPLYQGMSEELFKKRESHARLIRRFNKEGCLWSGVLKNIKDVKKVFGEDTLC